MPPEESDEALFAAWRGGSRTAADALCARYYWRVHRFFELKREREAEDLTQRTFLACVERPPEQLGSFRSYLFGIARRQLMRALRTEYTAAARRIGMGGDTSHTRLSGLAADREEQRLLLRALTELRLETQMILALHYWEAMTARQIAEVFDVSHDAMRSRIVRAREELRRTLEALHSPDAVRESLLSDLQGWARSVALLEGRQRG